MTKKYEDRCRVVYCDYSATTYVKSEVLGEMLPYFSMNFGNASSIYSIGRKAKEAMDKSRKTIAKCFNCEKEEIYFTSSGSEADNLALIGIARANKYKGNHIITTKIEHLAILNSCKALEKEGFKVTYLNVDKNGVIDLNELRKSITNDTIMISVMMANNEVGTYQPIEEVSKIAKENNIYFHSDAVQAIGSKEVDVKKLNLDAMSISSHKFYGPKGVGAVYIKNGIEFDSIIHGGHQENSKRAGTENVAGIVGMAKALELATENIDKHNQRVSYLRDCLMEKIKMKIPNVRFNADILNKLPSNVSSGSACNSGNNEYSHVLKAMNLDEELLKNTIRITLGEANTYEDIKYIANVLEDIVKGKKIR